MTDTGGPQVHGEIRQMQREIERLRDALRRIADDSMMTGVVTANQRTMWLIARDALNSTD